MCGLSGEIRFDGGRPDLAAVERMTDRLAPADPTAGACGRRTPSPWGTGD